MNKKAYIQPATEMMPLQLESIIAASKDKVSIFTDPVDTGGAGIKQMPFSDDEFDDLTNFDFNTLLGL